MDINDFVTQCANEDFQSALQDLGYIVHVQLVIDGTLNTQVVPLKTFPTRREVYDLVFGDDFNDEADEDLVHWERFKELVPAWISAEALRTHQNIERTCASTVAVFRLMSSDVKSSSDFSEGTTICITISVLRQGIFED